MARAVRLPLRLGFAGLCWLHGGLYAAEPLWDCRTGADGRSWVCSKDGQPVIDTTTPAAPAPRDPQGMAESPPADATSPATGRDDIEPPRPRKPTPPEAAPAATVAERPRPAAQAQAKPPTPAPRPEPPHRVEPSPQVTATSGDDTAQRSEDGAPDAAPPPTPARAPTPPTAAQADTAVTHAPQPAGPDTDTDTATAAIAITGGIDAGIDWNRCAIPGSDSTASVDAASPDTTVPILVNADAAVAELEPEITVFSGDVTLVQGSMRLDAAQLRLNRRTGEAEVSGGFVLNRPDVRVAGTTGRYLLSSEHGQVEQAAYRVPARRARGDAATAELLADGKSRYQDITYSTCRPGEDDWLLSAETLELDRVEGLGLARHATLRFMGVPMLYTPVFSFPIDDRRRSGVLIPSVGSSGNTGFDLSVPYYFNLAPNYDFTFTPRLLAKRGLLLGGEFRFLTEDSKGSVIAEFLPNDSDYDDGDQRGSVSVVADTRFNNRTTGAIRVNYVSDSDYLSDLGDSLAVTSAVFAERTGSLRYYGDTFDLLGRVQYYQTVDDSIASEDRPYSRLPQLRIDLQNLDGIAGTTYHLDAEYVNFHRDDSVRGHRLDLFPAISLPLENDWAYLEPKIGARYTAYDLTDQAADLSDSPSTLAGVFSVDGGLLFERPMHYFDNAATQTLEPRLFYLYVPNKDQDDQPVFDTGALDFNFDNLFRENRFNGPDRIGDANQLTLALSSRVVSSTSGAELLRASIGQTLYFEDRDVVLPGETVADDSTSSVVAELAAALGGGWHARTGVQWDPHDGSSGTIDQALAQLNYRDDDNRRVFNAAYRLRDGVIEQTDLATIWPLNEQFSLIGRHNFSLKESRLLEALAGIEYGECCWRVRALVRKYTDGAGDDHNLAFLIQLELNGLGRLGADIDKTLERGIYGYRSND